MFEWEGKEEANYYKYYLLLAAQCRVVLRLSSFSFLCCSTLSKGVIEGGIINDLFISTRDL